MGGFNPDAPYTPAATGGFDPSAPYSTASQPTGGLSDAVKGIGEGAVSGMQDTLSGLSKIPGASAISPVIGFAKSAMTPEAMTAERAAFAPKNKAEGVGEKAGSIGEGVLEFVLGDSALKGVGLMEKVGLASKLAKFAQENPYIGKLIDHLFTAGRQGLVAGAEEANKTGDVGEGVKAGIGTAVGSAALGAAGATIGKGADILGEAKGTEGAIRTAVSDVAKKAGVTPVAATSVRQSVESVSDALENKSQGIYKKLDNAAGGQNFQRFDVRIKNLTKQLRNVTSNEQFDKISDDIDSLENQKLQQLDKIKDAGKVDPDTYFEAKDLWRQKSKLEKLDSKVKMATQGKAGLTGSESTDPGKLSSWLVKMHDTGELQTALGGDAPAAQLIRDVASAKTAQDTIKTVVKYAIGAAGIGALGAIGAEAVKKATE